MEKANILVVANDNAVIDKVKACFTSQGHQIIPAYNIPLGFFLAQKNFPELILCETILKDGNALELLSEVRSDPDLVEIPFAIIDNTGGNSVEEAEATRYGIAAVIDVNASDGFIISELLPLIQQRLSKKEEREEYSPE